MIYYCNTATYEFDTVIHLLYLQSKLNHSQVKGYIFVSLGRLQHTCTLPHLSSRHFQFINIPLASYLQMKFVT